MNVISWNFAVDVFRAVGCAFRSDFMHIVLSMATLASLWLTIKVYRKLKAINQRIKKDLRKDVCRSSYEKIRDEITKNLKRRIEVPTDVYYQTNAINDELPNILSKTEMSEIVKLQFSCIDKDKDKENNYHKLLSFLSMAIIILEKEQV